MANAALDALRLIQREFAEKCADEVPAEWKTADQWASDARLSRPQVSKILTTGVAIGKVECREYRVATGHGVRSVKHYREKAKAKK